MELLWTCPTTCRWWFTCLCGVQILYNVIWTTCRWCHSPITEHIELARGIWSLKCTFWIVCIWGSHVVHNNIWNIMLYNHRAFCGGKRDVNVFWLRTKILHCVMNVLFCSVSSVMYHMKYNEPLSHVIKQMFADHWIHVAFWFIFCVMYIKEKAVHNIPCQPSIYHEMLGGACTTYDLCADLCRSLKLHNPDNKKNIARQCEAFIQLDSLVVRNFISCYMLYVVFSWCVFLFCDISYYMLCWEQSSVI